MLKKHERFVGQFEAKAEESVWGSSNSIAAVDVVDSPEFCEILFHSRGLVKSLEGSQGQHLHEGEREQGRRQGVENLHVSTLTDAAVALFHMWVTFTPSNNPALGPNWWMWNPQLPSTDW